MSNLVGLNGKPIGRQEKRQIGREITKDLGEIVPNIIHDIKILAFRSDGIIEILRMLGATDEHFQKAFEIVEAKRQQQTGEANN